jgi:hypothetical protein
MTRRWGILGVGALLSLSLTTGCVATGAAPERPRAFDTAAPPPPRPTEPPPLMLPRVTSGLSDDPLAHLEPPKPPPEPVIQIGSMSSPPSLSPQERVALAPVEVKERPEVTALRFLLEKHPLDALDALKKYNKRTQDTLLALLALVARVSEGGLDKASPEERAALLDQLSQAMTALRAPTTLSIEKMCYCRHIRNYGLYDPLPDDRVFAGGVDKKHGELVELYVEARNFVNRRNGEFCEVSLAGRLEIHDDARHELVWRHDFPADADHSLSPRQDYFINYWFWVPPMLEPGDYRLTLSIRDTNAAGKEGQWATNRSLPFHVGQGPSGRPATSTSH